MNPRLRSVLHWGTWLLLVAPLAICAVRLVQLVREPPMRITRDEGRTPSLEPLGPLAVGDRRVVVLPQGEGRSDGLVVFLATYFTKPTATFEICAAQVCERFSGRIENNSVVKLPVPAGFDGGELAVTLVSLEGGKLAYWSQDGAPLAQRDSVRGWAHPFARVGEYVRVQAGSWWWALFITELLVLVGALVFALWRSLSEREPRES